MKNAGSRSQWTRWPAFLLIALAGLSVRLPQLGARPMHTDEAVNAYIVGQLLAGEPFTYNPQDRHGPALAALALPLAHIRGAKAFSDLTESTLRLEPVLAGTATILLFAPAAEIFGFIPCLIAAILFAGAALPVYYDRYFIHESLFVAATFGFLICGWRAWQRGSIAQGVLAGISAALMLTCKETAVLHFAALAASAFVYWFWNLRRRACPASPRPMVASIAAITLLLLSVVLFTWFGRNWHALPAFLHGSPQFLARAGGQGHEKPFWYYAQLLAGGWSGGLLLALAGIGFFQTIAKRVSSPFGFLAWYAFFLAAIYSLIPYKTPWLALNFWLPITLFAARAVESLWRLIANHLSKPAAVPAFCGLVSLGAVLIARDTRQRVFVHPSEETNPYAYAHTSDDLLGLPVEIEQLSRQNAIPAPRIAVIASDPWPLPWYLRRFPQVGFWQPGQQIGQADFYVTSTEAAEPYADQLRNFRPEFFGARPGVLILLWSPAPKVDPHV